MWWLPCGRNAMGIVHSCVLVHIHTYAEVCRWCQSSWFMLYFSHWDRIASQTQSSPIQGSQLAEETPSLCLLGSGIQAGYCTHPTLMWVLGTWMLVLALGQQVLYPWSQLPSPHIWSFVHVSEPFKILNMKFFLPVFLISSSKLDTWYHFSNGKLKTTSEVCWV